MDDYDVIDQQINNPVGEDAGVDQALAEFGL